MLAWAMVVTFHMLMVSEVSPDLHEKMNNEQAQQNTAAYENLSCL